MREVIINTCHGGFNISEKGAEWLIENKDWEVTEWEDGTTKDDSADLVDVTKGPEGRKRIYRSKYSFVTERTDLELRTDPDLIECVKELGIDANGKHSELEIVEVPEDIDIEINEYDGWEWVAEEHRTWP